MPQYDSDVERLEAENERLKADLQELRSQQKEDFDRADWLRTENAWLRAKVKESAEAWRATWKAIEAAEAPGPEVMP